MTLSIKKGIDREKKKIDKNELSRHHPLIKKFPVRIGARSPYAVAEARTHGANRKWNEHSFEANQSFLSEHIPLPYEKMFDPVFGSRIFARNILEMISSCLHPVGLEAEFEKKSMDEPEEENDRSDPELNNNLIGAPVISITECRDSINVWGMLGNWANSGQLFDEPVQGPIPDCYYLAALSSLAWMGRNEIKKRQTNNISLYPPAGSVQTFGLVGNRPTPLTVLSLELPLKQVRDRANIVISTNLSTAKSKDPTENWVSFYEKTYAAYLENLGTIPATPQDPRIPDHPRVCLIPEGNPGSILTVLTGQLYNRFPWKLPYHFDAAALSACVNDVWVKLQSLCPDTGASSKKTSVTAVAYTYCTSDPEELKKLVPPVILNPVPDCAAQSWSGVLYRDDLLVASHAYSLLGIHADTRGHYVILRNPYGMNWGLDLLHLPYTLALGYKPDGTLANTVADGGSLVFDLPLLGFNLPSYPLFVANTANPVQYTVNNGVFALKIEDFVKWFRGFYWIT